ncbi:hypothetical protein MSG28_009513, partial [Choristoneura fumiferana]
MDMLEILQLSESARNVCLCCNCGKALAIWWHGQMARREDARLRCATGAGASLRSNYRNIKQAKCESDS